MKSVRRVCGAVRPPPFLPSVDYYGQGVDDIEADARRMSAASGRGGGGKGRDVGHQRAEFKFNERERERESNFRQHSDTEQILRCQKSNSNYFRLSSIILDYEYRVMQKRSCMFEFSRPPSALEPRQPMHSPYALTEHVSLNLAGFFLARPCSFMSPKFCYGYVNTPILKLCE